MTTARARRIAPAGAVVTYTRVSTDEQAASGAGLDAQRAAIEAEVARRGWTLAATYTDEGISGGKDVAQRPGLGYALDLIDAGHASILLVSKTDRLARGLRTLLDVIDRVNVPAVRSSRLTGPSTPARRQAGSRPRSWVVSPNWSAR